MTVFDPFDESRQGTFGRGGGFCTRVALVWYPAKMRMHFAGAVLVACSLPSCLPPTNACDPSASAAVQAEGTGITGRVIDQDGVGRAGVTVTVLGTAHTAVSGDDGTYGIENVAPSTQGYSVRAEPQAPAQGGTRVVGPVGCQERVEDADVVVAVAPEAPEVEMLRAVTSTSLVVAFGSGDTFADSPESSATFYDAQGDGGDAFRSPVDVALDCRSRANAAARAWRVQVRPPFEGWHDAVLNAFPWLDGAAAVGLGAQPSPGAFFDGDSLIAERTEDVCAAALCAQFSYLEASLADPRARCANVVGYIDGGDLFPLDAFGSYDVRVLTERKLDEQLVLDFALSTRVSSAAAARSVQISLVPGALLPLVDENGIAFDGRSLQVQSVIAANAGRFALVQETGVLVLGGGADVLLNAGVDQVGADAPQDAVAVDGLSAETVNADFLDDGDAAAVALAALPAGDWLRVVKESDAVSAVEKIFIGTSSDSALEGPEAEQSSVFDAVEATLPISPGRSALGTLRAISYLDPGSVSLNSSFANPADAYLLLYQRGFLLVENGDANSLVLAGLANQIDVNGGYDTDWDDVTALDGSALSAFDGDCGIVLSTDPAAFRVVGADDDANGVARKSVAACFDVAVATGGDVDLRDAAVFGGAEPQQVIADAAADRVLVIGLGALSGRQGRLVDAVVEVPVGHEPVRLTHSRSLDCGVGGDNVEVILVANAGSADVSVLQRRGDGTVAEVAVAALPVAPADFVDDVDGPTCEDPFAWVIAADGRIFPLDMRGTPSVPLCNGAPCEISSRGRARSGAISRDGVRPARAVVGGSGLVGELGFLRPAALPGGAYRVFEGNR